MNIYRFVEYKIPKSLLNVSLDFPIKQINYIDDKHIIKYLNDENNGNHYLIDKIINVSNEDKELYIKLLIIYLNGGLIINDKIVLNNVINVQKLYDDNKLCLIKSCLFDYFFDGFIMSKSKNEMFLNILNEYLEKNTNKLSLKEILYKNVTKIKKNKCLILTENIKDGISYIYNNTNIIAEHHFSSNILSNIKKINRIPKDLTKLKLGITIELPTNLTSLYSNGIRQNAFYFFELLKNMNYDVKLIIPNSLSENVLNSISFYKYDYVLLNNILYEEFDVIFSFGFSLPKNLFSILKKCDVKIVAYLCGNSYLIDSEKILYNQHKERTINYDHTKDETYDVLWSIPQMYKQNKYYWEIIYRTKCLQVPFIWSPSSIEFIKQIKKISNDEQLMYKKKHNNIAIFEPNISLMKWCLPCLLITELTNRKYKNINKVYMTNIDITAKVDDMKINHFNLTELNNICRGLDLFNEKKIFAERRYITLEFMESHADIAVSHQWENPLNYLYIDLAWMGWPILHNASLCKDLGYYYPDFNYEEASEKLNDILLHHDINQKEYLQYNRKIIDKYVPTNVELQTSYRNLIENLFN
jgi:hypothetical protein